MRSCRTVIAGLFGLLMAGTASAGEPTECDRLAGSPTDPNRAGAGVGLYGIEPIEAIAACEKALAADPHNPRLLFNLGRAYDAGSLDGKPSQQKVQAGRSIKAAADQGYAAAQIELAAYYWYGLGGMHQDAGEAMRLLDKAMVSDASAARSQRKNLFGDATFAPAPNEAQIRIIREAAKAGDAVALYALSLPLNLGDDRKAELADLLHKAAARGSAPAALDLAGMYSRGKGGLAKNLEEALRLIQQAAAGDDPDSWVSAAILYEKGNLGAPKDEKLAAGLLKQASDKGNASAQYYLGRFYDEGKGGLPQDPREAARLYKLAADQGNSDASVALARCMAEGRGGYDASKAKAVEYLKRAARWSTQAKDELAKMGG
jgi:TPR repeat protein